MSLCQASSASPVQGRLHRAPVWFYLSCFPFMVLRLSLTWTGQHIPHPGGHSLTGLLTADPGVLMELHCSFSPFALRHMFVVGLNLNQLLVGYSHKRCATIALVYLAGSIPL